MRSLPKDPNLMFSVVNTLLRDEFDSLSALCEEEDWDPSEIENTLAQAGYHYNEAENRFKTEEYAHGTQIHKRK